MPRKPLRECQDRDPKFRRQKRHGRRDTAFVELDGRRISLGPYDDPATRQAYYRVLAEWRAGRSPTPATIRPAAAAEAYTVGDLCDAYEPHARRRYVDGAGEPTDTRFLAASAMDALRRYEAGTPVDAFGPRALKRLRDDIRRLAAAVEAGEQAALAAMSK